MASIDAAFSGSIPTIYDVYLGPIIFKPYAEDIAERLSGLRSGRVLETAAGTGIVTRELDRCLAPDVSIVATDLNQPMLDLAAIRLLSDRLTWQMADASALTFPDSAFDAVIYQFGLMFLPNKLKACQEARRVLKPGGIFIFNVWDKLQYNELAEIANATAGDMFPDDPPQFLARTPHGYSDHAAIVETVRKAGFSKVAAETVTKRSRAPSSREPAFGFCQGSPLRKEIEARDATRLDAVTWAVSENIAARFGRGPVDAKMQAYVVTANN